MQCSPALWRALALVAAFDAIGAASGLEVGDCADDQLGRIDHADEAVLHEAAARAGHHDVPWGCTLCEASRGGTCYAHRRTVTS